MLSELIPEENRTEINILDVAAGTGLVGEELIKKGFTNIDAVGNGHKITTVL